MAVEVYGYSFKGNNSAIFILASFSVRVNSERKEFAPLGANCFLSERPYFVRLSLSREISRKSLKLSPFIKMAMHLK